MRQRGGWEDHAEGDTEEVREAGGLLRGEAPLALQGEREERGGDTELGRDVRLADAAMLDEVRYQGERVVSGRWHGSLPLKCAVVRAQYTAQSDMSTLFDKDSWYLLSHSGRRTVRCGIWSGQQPLTDGYGT